MSSVSLFPLVSVNDLFDLFIRFNATLISQRQTVSVMLLRREIPPESQEKLREFCVMSPMTILTLALTLSALTMKRKCCSVSRSPIDENNDSVGKSWIVFRHGIGAKLTFAAEFVSLAHGRS